MIQALLVFWVISAVLIILEKRVTGMIIYLSVFSLISALCMLLFAAPDVALAEAVISVFSTIIYIISFEKYYSHAVRRGTETKSEKFKKLSMFKEHIFPIIFSLFLFVLFIAFIPDSTANSFLKEQYLSEFSRDVGGENAVTAIYLGYRLYDTLFEALILLISIAAIIHLSWYKDFFSSQEAYINFSRSQISVDTIRIVSPVLILLGLYIILNGHISPGGGFQGGVIIASFFICRYMIHDIYDIPLGNAVKLEKIIYAGIVLLAMLFISIAVNAHLAARFSAYRSIYLVLMNLLIGMKVACGFFIIFFRFIAFERR